MLDAVRKGRVCYMDDALCRPGHREMLVYPFMARKLGKEGRVVLRLVLDAQGKLQRIDTED